MKIEDNFLKNEMIFNNRFESIGNNVNKDTKSTGGFSDVLKNVVNEVNGNMIESNKMTNSFIKGEDANIDEVMIKNQEASLSLQFLTQTRDKLLEGYNELSKMQL